MLKKTFISLLIIVILLLSSSASGYFMYIRGVMITSSDLVGMANRVPDIPENDNYLGFAYHNIRASHCSLASERSSMFSKVLITEAVRKEIDREIERIEALYRGRLAIPHHSIDDKMPCEALDN